MARTKYISLYTFIGNFIYSSIILANFIRLKYFCRIWIIETLWIVSGSSKC